MTEKVLMKGNEAFAEAAMRGGCKDVYKRQVCACPPTRQPSKVRPTNGCRIT